MWDLQHLKGFSSAMPLPLDFKPVFSLLPKTYFITGLLKDAIYQNPTSFYPLCQYLTFTILFSETQ